MTTSFSIVHFILVMGGNLDEDNRALSDVDIPAILDDTLEPFAK